MESWVGRRPSPAMAGAPGACFSRLRNSGGKGCRKRGWLSPASQIRLWTVQRARCRSGRTRRCCELHGGVLQRRVSAPAGIIRPCLGFFSEPIFSACLLPPVAGAASLMAGGFASMALVKDPLLQGTTTPLVFFVLHQALRWRRVEVTTRLAAASGSSGAGKLSS